MFQLNFYPHLDVHHAAFRAYCVGALVPTLTVDAYRMLDFFVTFPFEIGIVRLRGKKLVKLARQYEYLRPYKWSSEPLSVFLQMEEFQNSALRTLARKGVLSRAALDDDVFLVEKIDDGQAEIYGLASEFVEERRPVIEEFLALIEKYGVSGDDGLKARTGLMFFKYDPAKNVVPL